MNTRQEIVVVVFVQAERTFFLFLISLVSNTNELKCFRLSLWFTIYPLML